MCVLSDSNQCWYQARAGVYVVSKHRIPIWQKGNSSHASWRWGGGNQESVSWLPIPPPPFPVYVCCSTSPILGKIPVTVSKHGYTRKAPRILPPPLLMGGGGGCLVTKTSLIFVFRHRCSTSLFVVGESGFTAASDPLKSELYNAGLWL